VRSQEFAITKNRFPFLFSSSNITLNIKGGEVYSVPRPDATSTDFPDLKIYPPKAGDPVSTTGTQVGNLNGAAFTKNVNVDPQADNATWKLEVEDIDVFRKNVRDILMVVHYGI